MSGEANTSARPLIYAYICAIMHAMAGAVRFRLGNLSFAWDSKKAEANARRHEVTFEEAATTWLDPRAIERFDEEHSDHEDRWLRIGSSLRGALLVVWSTERQAATETVIRIIGVRRTNQRERILYAEHARTR